MYFAVIRRPRRMQLGGRQRRRRDDFVWQSGRLDAVAALAEIHAPRDVDVSLPRQSVAFCGDRGRVDGLRVLLGDQTSRDGVAASCAKLHRRVRAAAWRCVDVFFFFFTARRSGSLAVAVGQRWKKFALWRDASVWQKTATDRSTSRASMPCLSGRLAPAKGENGRAHC